MSKLLYQLINPPISLLLKSPLHWVMSANTLVVEFKGRRSGKTMETPISYHHADNAIHCFTARKGIWWRNLQEGKEVRLLIKGQWKSAIPEVVLDDQEALKASLDAFLRAVPRDAAHSKVRLEQDGSPNNADIQISIGELVLLKFRH